MCGIFGYVGSKNATEILLTGLKTLEYRGYDSAGVYVVGGRVEKSIGKVSFLTAKISKNPILGTTGIAHTRWATHGEPSERNAHPHNSVDESIWLVHNGIVENWKIIKDELLARGIVFTSDTDTEVLAKLIGTFYKNDLMAAVTEALSIVRGTYGIAVVQSHNPNEVIIARMGSPLVIGIGDGENFISSDPSALLSYTKEVVYLEDGEIAKVTAEGYELFDINGLQLQKTTEIIDWDVEMVQKNGFEHFMLKEIFEAPAVIESTIRGRLLKDNSGVKLGGLETNIEKLKELERLQIVGCGSAYYAGSVIKVLLEEYADLAVDIDIGSEYRYRKHFTSSKTALLAITQSGETADTLASVRSGKNEGTFTLGIVNAVGSTIARETEAGVYNHAGPEIAVASTKAFISQLTVGVLITVLLGQIRGKLKADEISEIILGLRALPKIIKEVLETTEHIKKVAQKYAKYNNIMYIGRKFDAPIAYEGSLKLKEVSYIHAEAYAGGELKHGPIALLSPNFPVLALVTDDTVSDKMLSNIEEVRARKAPVIVLATTGNSEIDDIADDILWVPKVHPILQPIITTIPLQLFAYYIGLEKGIDVDQPRNLAKSVTVE